MKHISELPDILKIESDEELDILAKENAKYFTVVEIRLGAFARGEGSNYLRDEVPDFESAMALAKEKHEKSKKTIMIYAVTDFQGARNFTRHIANYPPTLPVGKAAMKKFKEEQSRD